jgi:hypothetical protein
MYSLNTLAIGSFRKMDYFCNIAKKMGIKVFRTTKTKLSDIVSFCIQNNIHFILPHPCDTKTILLTGVLNNIFKYRGLSFKTASLRYNKWLLHQLLKKHKLPTRDTCLFNFVTASKLTASQLIKPISSREPFDKKQLNSIIKLIQVSGTNNSNFQL